MLRDLPKYMLTCPECGYEAKSEHALKIHHGRAHEGSIAGTEVECSVCGTMFRKRSDNAEKFDRHFCSTECKSEGYKNRVTLECDECGTTFDRRASAAEGVERNYCSNECKGRAYRDRVSMECRNCGDAFERMRSFANRSNGSYCSYECMYDHMQGAVHPKWKGGRYISDAIRRKIHADSWHKVRERHRDRLPAECAMCGTGENLALHHIVPLMAGGSHHPENFMILCQSCHQVAEFYTRDILDYPISNAIPA